MKTSKTPLLSVIMPVFNGGEVFRQCLSKALGSLPPNAELIVVDDCSTDGSAAIARTQNARLLSMDRRSGPAEARNAGVRNALGDIACFVDADCEVHPDTFDRIVERFALDPGLGAVFGSYDDQPASPQFIAQYKNLMHHLVHHGGRREAFTFWAGCGAVRRELFQRVGGFDGRLYPRPSIEDIELGYRLRRAGARITLDSAIQVRHHKAWTLRSMVVTDLRDRAIPWTELILSGAPAANDLNLQYRDRISAIGVWLLVLVLGFSIRRPRFLALALALTGILLLLNRDVYRYLKQKRGAWFVTRAIPLHWLYYGYSLAGFAIGSIRTALRKAGPGSGT
ncbi:MAG: glycosyltransferase family 2 protein [Acidobacteriota bacterium]